MEKEKIILGLDVSTTTIGICLMKCNNDEEKILKLTHVSPKVSSKISGIESLCIKKGLFESEFLNEYKEYGITDVIIEEPLLRSNNIMAVSVLLKFNALISDSVYNMLGIVPNYMSSYDARKYAFPELLAIRKFDKKGNAYPSAKIKKALKDNNAVLFGNYAWDIGKKEILLDKVSEKYPEIEWIYNKKGELKKENFDSSDSVVCCLGYINKFNNGEIDLKVSDVKKENDFISYNVNLWNKNIQHKIEINK
jgi:hypothetical protein